MNLPGVKAILYPRLYQVATQMSAHMYTNTTCITSWVPKIMVIIMIVMKIIKRLQSMPSARVTAESTYLRTPKVANLNDSHS